MGRGRIRGGQAAAVAVIVAALFVSGCISVGEEQPPQMPAGTEGLPAEAASEAPLQIPCNDDRGCPDLVVDPLHFYVGEQRRQTFSPTSCAVQEGLVKPGDRHLIKLSFNTPNQGDGSLIIGVAEENTQYFTYSDCHGHWHFDDFAHYRLWDAEAYLEWDELRNENPDWNASRAFEERPDLLARMVAGHKQGFCMMDLAPAVPTVHGYAVPPDLLPRYDCTMQGISRGWADIYHWLLDGQWIDVTDVAPGPYILEAESNPEHRFEEMAYGNNRAALPVAVLPLP